MATTDIARPDHAGKHTLTRRTALAGIAATPFMGAIPAAAAPGVSGDLAAIVDNYNAAYDAWHAADDRRDDVPTFEPSVSYPTPPKVLRSDLWDDIEEHLERARRRLGSTDQVLKFMFGLSDAQIAEVRPTFVAVAEREIRDLPALIAAEREAEQAANAEFMAVLQKIEAEKDAAGVTAAEEAHDAAWDAAWQALSAACDALLAYTPQSLDEVRSIARCMIGKHDRHELLRARITDDRIDDWCRALAGLPPEADDAEPEAAAA